MKTLLLIGVFLAAACGQEQSQPAGVEAAGGHAEALISTNTVAGDIERMMSPPRGTYPECYTASSVITCYERRSDDDTVILYTQGIIRTALTATTLKYDAYIAQPGTAWSYWYSAKCAKSGCSTTNGLILK